MIVRVLLMFLVMLFMELDVNTVVVALDMDGLKSGVVKITATEENRTKVGTGFIVRLEADLAYIVTAAHVIGSDPQPKVEFFTNPNSPVRGRVLNKEAEEVTSLALLVVQRRDNFPSGITALPIATAVRLSGGEDIVVIGHPRSAGDWTVLKGSVARREGRHVKVDANVDEGSSGGPMLQNGKVVGLVAGTTKYGLAVTASSLREYLDGNRVPLEEEARTAQATSPGGSPAKPEPPGLTKDREMTGKDDAPMVLIPAGRFLMGSAKDEVDRVIKNCVKKWGVQTCEDWYRRELPQHTVEIEAFYLDKYEVTNRLFHQFVQQTDHQTTAEKEGYVEMFNLERMELAKVKGAHWQRPEGKTSVFQSDRGDHPVVIVSWDDAAAYCQWALKRLPTEAEFEYAMRAGTTTKYWWGQENPVAQRSENTSQLERGLTGLSAGFTVPTSGTAPVGSYEANPWGLYDISGNVQEWVADWYERDYYSKSPVRNPKGPSSGQYRVIRGGSFASDADQQRSFLRERATPRIGETVSASAVLRTRQNNLFA